MPHLQGRDRSRVRERKKKKGGARIWDGYLARDLYGRVFAETREGDFIGTILFARGKTVALESISLSLRRGRDTLAGVNS